MSEVHEFQGRLDRWCEICDKPDRDPIHTAPEPKLDPERMKDKVWARIQSLPEVERERMLENIREMSKIFGYKDQDDE